MSADKSDSSSPPAASPSLPARTRWKLFLVLGFGVALLLVLIAVPAPKTSFERTASLPAEPPEKPQILAEPPRERAPVYPPAVAALPSLPAPLPAPPPAPAFDPMPRPPSFEELAPTVPASGAPSPWRLPPAELDPFGGRRPSSLDPELARRRRLSAPLTASDVPPPPAPAPEDPVQPSTAPFLRSMLDATQGLTGLTAGATGGLSAGLPALPSGLAAAPPGPAAAGERQPPLRLRPGQPFVPRGTVIPALLLYPVASPAGEGSTAVALVTEDVADSTGSWVAVPKGSRLFGSPLAGATNSKRLLLVWQRLLLPDGRSLEIPAASTRDELLAEGLAASGRSPVWSALGKAALLGVLGSGAQLATPEPRANGYLPPASATAASVAAEISEVGRELVHQSLSLTPYFTVPGGTRLNLLLTDDLPL